MKKKLYIFSLIILLTVFTIPSALAQEYGYLAKKDTLGTKTILTFIDKDYVHSPLLPNTSVTLTFLIQDSRNPGLSQLCPEGIKMIAFLKHWTGSSFDFPTIYNHPVPNFNFTYNFNSGTAGQANKYSSIFICSNQGISGTTVQNQQRNIDNLKNQALAWESYPLELVTKSAPSLSFDPPLPSNSTYAPDTKINIVASNLPSALGNAQCGAGANNPNYVMKVKLNNNPDIRFFCFPYPFSIKTGAVEGAVDMTGGDNSLSVFISDTQGNIIARNSISFKVGQPAAAPPGPGQPGTPAVNPPCTDPAKCLYNPLPQEDLTSVFLSLVKGFLAITGIWAVMFIIVGGFQMVMAAGNEEMYLKAKKTIIWAILGLVIAMLAFSIVAIVQSLLNATIK